MTRQLDLDHAIEEWLIDGPSQLSDRATDAIVNQLDHTKQRRPGWLPGRYEMNRTLFALGGIAAAVALIVVAGAMFLGLNANRPGLGGPPSPSPTASPTAEPSASETSSPADGNAVGPFVFYDAAAGGVPVTVTIPTHGWYGEPNERILVKDNANAPDGAGMILFQGAQYVYGDPCEWSTTRPDTPASTVDELVAALGSQVSRDASAPVDVTVDGYAGKSITLHVPADAVFSECDRGQFRTLVEDPAVDSARFHQDPGQIDKLWIVDVDGVLMVFFAAYYEGTPQSVVDELEAIVESITFE